MSLQDIMDPPELPPPPEDPPKDQKTPMRSWRKKYRKMNLRFQKAMEESNQLWKDEHKAKALTRRLQEEVDQLLEILLDMNEDEHVPEHYDLVLPDDPPDLQLYKQPKLKDGATMKSLEEMLKRIPHTEEVPSDPSLLPPDLTGDKFLAFLDPAYEEEYFNNLDAQLGDDEAAIIALAERGIPPGPSRYIPTDKDLQTSNPNSVISWLRRHHPETFIQDKDNQSEKAAAKPRGPGKRMSIAAQATPQPKPDPDAVDEDGGPGEDVAPRKGGNKRSKDDEPYRPKGGSSKKRKREDGEKGSSRSKKTKAAPAAEG